MGNAFSQNKAGVVIGLAASVVGTGLWYASNNVGFITKIIKMSRDRTSLIRKIR